MSEIIATAEHFEIMRIGFRAEADDWGKWEEAKALIRRQPGDISHFDVETWCHRKKFGFTG